MRPLLTQQLSAPPAAHSPPGLRPSLGCLRPELWHTALLQRRLSQPSSVPPPVLHISPSASCKTVPATDLVPSTDRRVVVGQRLRLAGADRGCIAVCFAHLLCAAIRVVRRTTQAIARRQ